MLDSRLRMLLNVSKCETRSPFISHQQLRCLKIIANSSPTIAFPNQTIKIVLTTNALFVLIFEIWRCNEHRAQPAQKPAIFMTLCHFSKSNSSKPEPQSTQNHNLRSAFCQERPAAPSPTSPSSRSKGSKEPLHSSEGSVPASPVSEEKRESGETRWSEAGETKKSFGRSCLLEKMKVLFVLHDVSCLLTKMFFGRNHC